MKEIKSFTLTKEVIVKIKEEAKRNNRSLSNMVEHILRSHFIEKDRPASSSQ